MSVWIPRTALVVAVLALTSLIADRPLLAGDAPQPCAQPVAQVEAAPLFMTPALPMTPKPTVELLASPFEPLQAGCLQVCRACAAEGEYCCATSPGNCTCC